MELAPEPGASHTTVPKLTLKFLAPLFEVGCLVRKGHGTQTTAPSNLPPPSQPP